MSDTHSHYILVITRKIKSWICERGGEFSSTFFKVRVKEQEDTLNHHNIFILFTEAQKRNLSWLTLHGKGPTPMCVCARVCVCWGWMGSQSPSSSSQSVTQSHLTLCDPMDCSTPGFSVFHHLLELVQTHVHWVGDAIQPSHPLSFPSPPPSIFPSIRVFSNESVLRLRLPKYWIGYAKAFFS